MLVKIELVGEKNLILIFIYLATSESTSVFPSSVPDEILMMLVLVIWTPVSEFQSSNGVIGQEASTVYHCPLVMIV